MKVIFHLDLDSYFVSAARTVYSELKDLPVAIGSKGRRSVVSAVSYEAREKGVYAGMPQYKAKEIIPNIKIVEPDFALYITLSSKLFELISNNFTDKIEVGSIDECYIDATDIWEEYGSPVKLAKELQKSILKELSLPCSIGISNNKFVAKMSTSLKKPLGISVTKPNEFLEKFKDKPIGSVFGIGSQSSKKLIEIGIDTIGKFASAPIENLRIILGIRADTLMWNINGNGEDEIKIEHNDIKEISNAITFQWGDQSSKNKIISTLKSLVNVVSQRAENRNMVGKVVSVYIKSSGGKEVKTKRKQMTLTNPISKINDILECAISLFDEIWDENSIKHIGVSLGQLEDKFSITYQGSIFDKKNNDSDVQKIIKDLNRSFKSDVAMSAKEYLKKQNKKNKQSRYIESDRLLKK